MKALLKTIGIIIGIVIVLFVAIAIIVPIYFHPNDYKDEIAAAVQEKTGRELKIEGDIVLSVFPWLAVELGALELGNAPDFSDEKFASLEKMEIGVKLLPLLSKRLEMRAVTVHGLELNLAKDKKGQTNWADLAELLEHEDGKAKKQSEGEAKEDAKENGALPIAALGIGGLDIRGAALRWNDAQSAQQYQLEGLTIETGAITLGEAVDLAISFDMKGNKPQISGHIETKAKLTADLAANTYQLSGFDVVTRLAGEPIPNGKMALELKADISADLAEQTLRVENLRFATGQIDASGAMTVNQLMEAPAFDGKLQLQTFNPRTLLTEFGQQIPETADPKALTAVSLSATLKGTADRVRMEALTIQLDDTAMNGSLEVANFSAPAIRFNLDADAIDADRYLPPTEDKAAKPATPGTAASGATELPFEALRALNVNGKARLGKLTIAKLKLSDVALDVTAKGGVIKLSPVKMNLYEGNYAGNIGIDARGDKARITLDEKLANVQAGPLLNDLQGDDILSGKVQFALDLKTVGATPEDFKKTLNGQAGFTFENGMVKGIDIIHTVCNAVGNIGKLAGGSNEGPSAGTEFQSLAGKLPITNGRVGINDTLLLKAPLLRIQGVGGNIDVGAHRFNNVKFIVKPSFTCEGQGGKALSELSGADIPITCNGPMEGKSCLPDPEALLNLLTGNKVEEIKEKVKGKVEEKLEKVVSEKLGGSLGDKLGDKLKDELGKKAAESLGGGLKGLLGR